MEMKLGVKETVKHPKGERITGVGLIFTDYQVGLKLQVEQGKKKKEFVAMLDSESFIKMVARSMMWATGQLKK